MDEALYYLLEAQDYIDSFVDISLADSFFEETEEAKAANEQNEKASTGAIAALKKAFSVMIKAVQDTIDSFKDMFASRDILTAAERERYAEFKRMVKSDPELAKKKVTMVDWQAYEKAYAEALKEMEDECKKDNPDQKKLDGITGKLNEKLAKYSSRLSKSADRATDAVINNTDRAISEVSLSTAIDLADNNAATAKLIKKALDEEIIDLKDIEADLGKKAAVKFERKINAYARNGVFHRMKVKLFRHKTNTFRKVMKKQYSHLMSEVTFGALTTGKDGKVKLGDSTQKQVDQLKKDAEGAKKFYTGK